jgi:hypothetical protein
MVLRRAISITRGIGRVGPREIETFLGHLGPKKVENMDYVWEFFLCFYFVPYKVNISMYVGGFKQVQRRKIFVRYK